MARDLLTHCSAVGPFTAIGDPRRVDEIPADPADLRAVVAETLMHPAWAKRYGVTVTSSRTVEEQVRRADRMLDTLAHLSPGPLITRRDARRRMFGVCRNFTVLHVALLRHVGVPARARCGFANYFEKGKWVDHWVTEYWSHSESRWIKADAQLDPFQVKATRIDWSPGDIPTGAFITAGECWSKIRNRDIHPQTCGIFDMWGSWFVRGNVIRDLAAMNNHELLPWDGWGFINDWSALDSEGDNLVIDEVSEVCASDELDRLTAAFHDPRFRVPPTINSIMQGKAITVDPFA